MTTRRLRSVWRDVYARAKRSSITGRETIETHDSAPKCAIARQEDLSVQQHSEITHTLCINDVTLLA